ncbi:MAG: NAD kinase [Saprospiraceae bacterium]
MQVIVFSKTFKQKDLPASQALFDALAACQINTYVYGPYLKQIKPFLQFTKDVGIFEGYVDFSVKKFDLCITLGGDGTILDAVTHIRDSMTPILGINLGRLGFLATIETKNILETVQKIQRNMFRVEERRTLYLESNLPLFDDQPFALNDFTILKRDTSSMIIIHTYINGSYLNSYWADGIIVSTPTGSTGYSLSCGGPIIFPGSGNFVITPVAPHNLNVRPIVISDDAVISFEVEGRAENFLCTLDSRFETITAAHQLAVRKNNFNIKLISLSNVDFLDTLRDKLNWGQDVRND